MNVSDSVYLITGGSSGLGAATARMALEAGARVVIADLAEPRIGTFDSAAAAERLAFVQTNVVDEASGQAAVQMALQRFGRLDVLVNAAGIGPAEKIHGKTGPHRLDSFTKTIQVNLIGTFNMMRLAVPAMIHSGTPGSTSDPTASQGVIINTASVAAFDGQIGQAAYSASKGGVAMLTKSMAVGCGPLGVRVNAIGHDRDARARPPQKAQLAQRFLAAADNDDGAGLHVEEDGEVAHREAVRSTGRLPYLVPARAEARFCLIFNRKPR